MARFSLNSADTQPVATTRRGVTGPIPVAPVVNLKEACAECGSRFRTIGHGPHCSQRDHESIPAKQAKQARTALQEEKTAVEAEQNRSDTPPSRKAQLKERAKDLNLKLNFAKSGLSVIDNDTEVAVPRTSPQSHTSKEKTAMPATKTKSAPAKKAATKKSAPKVKVPKEVRYCQCGCGTTTGGNFAPGHDARLVGMIKRGELRKLSPFQLEFAKNHGIKPGETAKAAK